MGTTSRARIARPPAYSSYTVVVDVAVALVAGQALPVSAFSETLAAGGRACGF